MPTEKLSMRNVREILRQMLELKRTHRAVAKALGISNGAVGTLMVRWKASRLDWAAVKELAEDELEQRLFGPRLPASVQRPLPDMLWLFRELKRPAVTLEVLHLEYLEANSPHVSRHAGATDNKRRLALLGLPHMATRELFVGWEGVAEGSGSRSDPCASDGPGMFTHAADGDEMLMRSTSAVLVPKAPEPL